MFDGTVETLLPSPLEISSRCVCTKTNPLYTNPCTPILVPSLALIARQVPNCSRQGSWNRCGGVPIEEAGRAHGGEC